MPDREQRQESTITAGQETHVSASTSVAGPMYSPSETIPLPAGSLLHQPSMLVPSSPLVLRPAKQRRKGSPGSYRRRRMDRLILQYCALGPTELSGLTDEIARSTLYRRAASLVQSGALKRRGRTYQTTTVGQCWLAEELSHIEWNIFDRLYPPFASVPSPHHKALLELLLAEAVVRKAGCYEHHLCAFVAMGGTLRWKTTCGRMACIILGVDPGVNLIDLASESGRSVFIRRSSQGQLLTQRNILSSPLAVFDDFLQASDALRDAVRPFLSGRRTIPYDNGVIAVDCVTLVTLNPRPGQSLQQQTTWDPAQLRRVIVCNCDAVPMPDLSLTGHLALEAAVKLGPLQLPALRTDLQAHRAAVVQLIHEVVRPERHDHIDTEMLLQLAAGMTGFIEEDERAIQQVVFDFGLLIDTLGWANPDWVTPVNHFSLHSNRPARIAPPHPPPPSVPDSEAVHDVILLRRRMMYPSESNHSPYTLSEEARARLIVMAAEEQISFEQALDVVTDYYHSAMKSLRMDLHDLHSILELSKELKMRELPVKHVKVTLTLLGWLEEYELEPEAFEPALHLLQRLQKFGLTSAPASDVTRILDVACELVSSGISQSQMEQWLARRATEAEP